jgi:hypothetical protein
MEYLYLDKINPEKVEPGCEQEVQEILHDKYSSLDPDLICILHDFK